MEKINRKQRMLTDCKLLYLWVTLLIGVFPVDSSDFLLMFISLAQFKIENFHGCLKNLHFNTSKCKRMHAGATFVHLILRRHVDVFSRCESVYKHTCGYHYSQRDGLLRYLI